jgi:hypothetical protein
LPAVAPMSPEQIESFPAHSSSIVCLSWSGSCHMLVTNWLVFRGSEHISHYLVRTNQFLIIKHSLNMYGRFRDFQATTEIFLDSIGSFSYYFQHLVATLCGI